jgi:hypothetical protein
MLARQIAIGFGVAIVFPLLVYYGVSTFFHAPKWDDYAGFHYDPKLTPEAARQQHLKESRVSYEEARRVFSLRLLCISAPLGYLAIVLGAIGDPSGLKTGLIFGGISTVTTGYWFHWSYIEDWLRFVSLLVAMAILVFISYWRSGLSRHSGTAR